MKLFGKRDRREGQQPGGDTGAFGVPRLPRPAGPPASSTPLADQLAHGGPGVTDDYVVLPRSIAEQMPLPWQRQLVDLLAQFHHTHGHRSWPEYRVLPSREERLVDLDEEQLAAVGFIAEIDPDGALVYRERNGRPVDDAEAKRVLVTCLDPIVVDGAAEAKSAASPVPINVGPQPVWTVPGAPDTHPPAHDPSADDDTPPRGIPVADPAEQASVDWFGDPTAAGEVDQPRD